jgi:hypothetical protein
MHTQIGEGGGVRSKGGKSKIKSQKGLARKWFDRLTIREQSRGKAQNAQKGEKNWVEKCDCEEDSIRYNLPKVCGIPFVVGNCGFGLRVAAPVR